MEGADGTLHFLFFHLLEAIKIIFLAYIHFFCNFGHLPWLSCHTRHSRAKANSPVATLTLRSPYFSHSHFFLKIRLRLSLSYYLCTLL